MAVFPLRGLGRLALKHRIILYSRLSKALSLGPERRETVTFLQDVSGAFPHNIQGQQAMDFLEEQYAQGQQHRSGFHIVAATSLKFTGNIVRVGLNYQFH